MASRHRLSATLSSRKAFLPFDLTLNQSHFLEKQMDVILDNIYLFPLEWRKFILGTCRMQVSPKTNYHLVSAAYYLPPTIEVEVPTFGDQHFLHFTANLSDVIHILDLFAGLTIA